MLRLFQRLGRVQQRCRNGGGGGEVEEGVSQRVKRSENDELG